MRRAPRTGPPGPAVTTLDLLPAGGCACIADVAGEDPVALRLLEMGLLPGHEVRMVRRAPLGDPIEVEVLGYRLVLRTCEAACVTVKDVR